MTIQHETCWSVARNERSSLVAAQDVQQRTNGLATNGRSVALHRSVARSWLQSLAAHRLRSLCATSEISPPVSEHSSFSPHRVHSTVTRSSPPWLSAMCLINPSATSRPKSPSLVASSFGSLWRFLMVRSVDVGADVAHQPTRGSAARRRAPAIPAGTLASSRPGFPARSAARAGAIGQSASDSSSRCGSIPRDRGGCAGAALAVETPRLGVFERPDLGGRHRHISRRFWPLFGASLDPPEARATFEASCNARPVTQRRSQRPRERARSAGRACRILRRCPTTRPSWISRSPIGSPKRTGAGSKPAKAIRGAATSANGALREIVQRAGALEARALDARGCAERPLRLRAARGIGLRVVDAGDAGDLVAATRLRPLAALLVRRPHSDDPKPDQVARVADHPNRRGRHATA
jgi:hypothetical protein